MKEKTIRTKQDIIDLLKEELNARKDKTPEVVEEFNKLIAWINENY